MNILAIETSCDETAVALVRKEGATINILANIVSSQIELHRKWGGVVPNLAGREHAKNIIPVLDEALTKATMTQQDIDLIAVTAGPGLIPALLIGVSMAKTLAYRWNKPLLGIHHIEGHLYANWITAPQPTFPLIALIVSGGHTQLVHMRDHCTYEIIGQTQDDAVGEAFDKVARMLGLPYPGGVEISAQAKRYDAEHNAYSFALPRPMLQSNDYHFSFSGLKTAALYRIREEQKRILQDQHPHHKQFSKEDYASCALPQAFVQAMAHAFQEAVTDVLIQKTLRAASAYNVSSIILAGGVSANTQLRHELGDAIKKDLPTVSYHIPDMAYCLDNASMIGTAAAYRYERMDATQKEEIKNGWQTVSANPGLKMSSL